MPPRGIDDRKAVVNVCASLRIVSAMLGRPERGKVANGLAAVEPSNVARELNWEV